MSIVDNFHEAVNDFILKENNIISILRIIKISIESYERKIGTLRNIASRLV